MKQATNQVIYIPNNEVITSSFKVQIPASSVICKKAQDSHAFKNLHSESIISLRKLFDDGCNAILDKNEFMLLKIIF